LWCAADSMPQATTAAEWPRPPGPRGGDGPGADHRLVAMTVRELTAEDRSAYRRLSSGAFGGPVDDAPPAAFDLAQIPLGIDSAALPGGADGVIAAGARIRRDRITVAGGVADCGGIGGLAVHPAHRGDG